MDDFEKYLVSRINFCKSMLSVFNTETPVVTTISVELETLESILHHFNLFVKGETNDQIKE